MYSTKKNIQQLLSLMIQHQVTDIVISPGSRNMPLAQSFANDSHFHCHPVTDERSAGFYAIGLSISLEKPVAVCVTSGSALLNLCSAVSEAYYQRIPLLVLSADRPAAWIGQMDGQTLPQTGVFGTLIRKEVTLPEPSDTEQEWFCNRLINEALIELRHRVEGPVHINVPITEPFFDCSAENLPNERVIMRNAPYNEAWNKAQRPLIIVGQLTRHLARHIAPLLKRLNVPVLCEHFSNLGSQSPFIYNTDLLLAKETITKEDAPDLVVYLGGHILSKRLKKWLRTIPSLPCWRIDPEGECSDTFQNLTNIIEQSEEAFLASLTPSTNDAYLSRWTQISENTTSNTYNEHSSLSTVAQFMQQINSLDSAALLLANSSSVRYAQLHPLDEKIWVSCNRGINGIDGSLSAAVGFATAHPEMKVFLLIGDLSFFYDMNALWNTQLPTNLRILLINNDGGEIFRVLPGLEKTEGAQQYVMAMHHTSAQGWVESVGCHYLKATTAQEAATVIHELIYSTSQQALVAEVWTDPIIDEKVFRLINKK